MRALCQRPITYLITTGEATPDNFETQRKLILDSIRSAVECGISCVQIREKLLTAKLLYQLVTEVADLTRSSSTRLLVNDRVDIAVAAGADGVHLTSNSMSAGDVRTAFWDEILIAVSTHSLAGAEAAASEGADLVVFGPIFKTPGKGDPVGLTELATVCAKVAPFPVLALGGVDAENFQQVIDAGAAGFAGIRCFNDAYSLRRIANQIEYLNAE